MKIWRWLCSSYLRFPLCEKFHCQKFRYIEVIHKKRFLSFLEIVCGIYENVCYIFVIFQERRGMNMIFCVKINVKVFYKVVVSFLLVIERHAQST